MNGSYGYLLRFQSQFETSVNKSFLNHYFCLSFFSLENLHRHSSFLSSGLLAYVKVVQVASLQVVHRPRHFGCALCSILP